MTALIILGSIAIVILLLMLAEIRADITYINEQLSFKVKYLLFTVYPPKPKKEPKPKIKPQKAAKKVAEKAADVGEDITADDEKAAENISDNDNKTNEENIIGQEPIDIDIPKKSNRFVTLVNQLADKKNALSDRLDQLKAIWKYAEKPLKRIFAETHISRFYIDFKITGSDAYEAAMNYGKISAAVYNVIGIIRVMFPIKFKTVDIGCDFEGKKSVYDCGLSVRLSLGTAAAAVIVLLFNFVKHKDEMFPDSGKVNNNTSAADNI